MSTQPEITLHTYFRSSCSARIRIALHLKGLKYTPVYIHLLKGEQSSEPYTSLNPSCTVPTITFSSSNREEPVVSFVLTQSMAILEYLDEKFPAPDYTPLLPSGYEDKARVRQLYNIIACDMQPLMNLDTLKQVKKIAEDSRKEVDATAREWQQRICKRGFGAYETLVSKTAGKYSFGDTITMADVCLAPAVDSALRFGVDMSKFETTERVWRALEEVEAFKKGGWRAQGDTPEELRAPAGN
ncbi:hypothetical protein TWF730_010687 [Orbilia blumenaviensis]|uniref:Maleylacetoacetate isomerase n=1 Tax=Orbilia blumenaviensis TaxID=1796055 RepID=A0AAV9UNX0_9PEZI